MIWNFKQNWDHSFSKYAKLSKKINISYQWYVHVKNVGFTENFAYVLNEWSLGSDVIIPKIAETLHSI